MSFIFIQNNLNIADSAILKNMQKTQYLVIFKSIYFYFPTYNFKIVLVSYYFNIVLWNIKTLDVCNLLTSKKTELNLGGYCQIENCK